MSIEIDVLRAKYLKKKAEVHEGVKKLVAEVVEEKKKQLKKLGDESKQYEQQKINSFLRNALDFISGKYVTELQLLDRQIFAQHYILEEMRIRASFDFWEGYDE